MVDVLANSQGIRRWYPAEDYLLEERDTIMASVIQMCPIPAKRCLLRAATALGLTIQREQG